jgi:citrate synthase
MSNIFGKLRKGASKTAFEADKLMRVRKAEGELAQIRKDIDVLQERLGEITYLNYIHSEPQGQDSIDYIEKISALEQQVTAKQEEISNIQAETFEKSETTSTPIDSNYAKCPNCGKMNPATVKFCSECGTKLS